MTDYKDLEKVTKRLLWKDLVINVILPMIVGIFVLVNGVLIGINIESNKRYQETTKQSVEANREFLKELIGIAYGNRKLINEARLKVGLPADDIFDELYILLDIAEKNGLDPNFVKNVIQEENDKLENDNNNKN